MAYKKYKTANNAICGLAISISNIDSSVKAVWPYSRFPSENFIIKITERDVDGKVIARENMYVTTRSWDTFSIGQRACEPVPMDDEATEETQTALEFNAGATIELVVSGEIIKDIQEEVEKKLYSEWSLRTDMTSKSIIVIDENGEEKEIFFWDKNQSYLQVSPDGKTLQFSNPPLDIYWQDEDTSIDPYSDFFVTYDTSWSVNKKVKVINAILLRWDWSDWALNGTADITIAGSNNSIIYKNYTSISAWNKWSQAYINDPAVWSSVVLNMTNTSLFAVNDYVRVSSSAGWETAKVTAVSTNVSITVDALTINHSTTSPLVTRLTKFTITPTNCLLYIRCRWNVDLTNWYFDFQWKWGVGWNGWGVQAVWSMWSAWNTRSQFLSNAGGGWLYVFWEGQAGGAGGAVSFTHYMDNQTVLKMLSPSCGWGGWGGAGGHNGGAWSAVWGAGGAGGGCAVLMVQWNVTVSATTTLNFKGANGVNWGGWGINDWAGWGGGGWGGWDCMILYTWSLIWSITPLVTGWTWGTGRNWQASGYWSGWGGGANKMSAWAQWGRSSGSAYWPSGAGGTGGTWSYFISKFTTL